MSTGVGAQVYGLVTSCSLPYRAGDSNLGDEINISVPDWCMKMEQERHLDNREQDPTLDTEGPDSEQSLDSSSPRPPTTMLSSGPGRQNASSAHNPALFAPAPNLPTPRSSSIHARLPSTPEHESFPHERCHHKNAFVDTGLESNTAASDLTRHSTVRVHHHPLLRPQDLNTTAQTISSFEVRNPRREEKNYPPTLYSTAPSGPSLIATAPLSSSMFPFPLPPSTTHLPRCPLHGPGCDGVSTLLPHLSQQVTELCDFSELYPRIVRGDRTMVDWERLLEEERERLERK